MSEGPLPDQEADEDEIERRAGQLEAIPRPVSLAEAAALASCFGPDDCYGVAWTLAHLIETAPGPVPTARPAPDAGAHGRVRRRAVAAGLVPDDGAGGGDIGSFGP
ncbi:hypothetical protein [Streptomyces sp. S3(2020)]|uniref:hypothetical protein n=1 Tax=Streptomyces sp. S3(2020) TaxID=2732044 RepID=UPI0032180C15